MHGGEERILVRLLDVYLCTGDAADAHGVAVVLPALAGVGILAHGCEVECGIASAPRAGDVGGITEGLPKQLERRVLGVVVTILRAPLTGVGPGTAMQQHQVPLLGLHPRLLGVHQGNLAQAIDCNVPGARGRRACRLHFLGLDPERPGVLRWRGVGDPVLVCLPPRPPGHHALGLLGGRQFTVLCEALQEAHIGQSFDASLRAPGPGNALVARLALATAHQRAKCVLHLHEEVTNEIGVGPHLTTKITKVLFLVLNQLILILLLGYTVAAIL
mmetsp:Transcript_55868/g.126041  ORF Transcript_55868/g.126041 Transcript_55868/m.126041 type:complete len:273 (+) Transcript_55868:521-1339(+)